MRLRSLLALLASLLVIPAQGYAQRLVSVGGTLTEIVYLLGEEAQLVAVDTSSLYPAAAQALPKVGYQRTLSAEGVLAARPDRVLITQAAGPQKVLHQLEDSGVELVKIEAPDTPEGIRMRIAEVARVLGVPEKGDQAIAELDRQLAGLQTSPWWVERPPRILFLLQMGGAPMVAGRGTAPDSLFALAGAVNAAGALEGYRTLTPEALLAAAPDAILVSDQGLVRSGGKAAIWQLPGMAATPAGQAKRLLQLDALLVLGLGPRTPEAVQQLQAQLEDWRP